MQSNTNSSHFDNVSLQVLDEVDSTNDYLKSLTSKSTPLKEFTAIMAIDQVRGRGQRDRIFLSDKGQSLTFSIILYPDFLFIEQQFYLNIVISLAIKKWLDLYTKSAKIKWPNDIMIENKKLGGVLIENNLSNNRIKRTVVGIGLNIFQQSFHKSIERKATSIAQHVSLNQDTSIENLCRQLIAIIIEETNAFRLIRNFGTILELYNQVLYRKNELCSFMLKNEEIISAKVLSVDQNGLLHVDLNSKEETFMLNELTLLY